jgi:hypothetical protein
MTAIAPAIGGVTGAAREPSLFAFVEAGHPFAPAVDRFREAFAARPEAAAWLADAETVLHAGLAPRRRARPHSDAAPPRCPG